MAMSGRQSFFWIGLIDLLTDETFYWTDSSIIAFTNWGTGQPSKKGNVFPSCVSMKPSGRWINRECLQSWGYICEAGGLNMYEFHCYVMQTGEGSQAYDL